MKKSFVFDRGLSDETLRKKLHRKCEKLVQLYLQFELAEENKKVALSDLYLLSNEQKTLTVFIESLFDASRDLSRASHDCRFLPMLTRHLIQTFSDDDYRQIAIETLLRRVFTEISSFHEKIRCIPENAKKVPHQRILQEDEIFLCSWLSFLRHWMRILPDAKRNSSYLESKQDFLPLLIATMHKHYTEKIKDPSRWTSVESAAPSPTSIAGFMSFGFGSEDRKNKLEDDRVSSTFSYDLLLSFLKTIKSFILFGEKKSKEIVSNVSSFSLMLIEMIQDILNYSIYYNKKTQLLIQEISQIIGLLLPLPDFCFRLIATDAISLYYRLLVFYIQRNVDDIKQLELTSESGNDSSDERGHDSLSEVTISSNKLKEDEDEVLSVVFQTLSTFIKSNNNALLLLTEKHATRHIVHWLQAQYQTIQEQSFINDQLMMHAMILLKRLSTYKRQVYPHETIPVLLNYLIFYEQRTLQLDTSKDRKDDVILSEIAQILQNMAFHVNGCKEYLSNFPVPTKEDKSRHCLSFLLQLLAKECLLTLHVTRGDRFLPELLMLIRNLTTSAEVVELFFNHHGCEKVVTLLSLIQLKNLTVSPVSGEGVRSELIFGIAAILKNVLLYRSCQRKFVEIGGVELILFFLFDVMPERLFNPKLPLPVYSTSTSLLSKTNKSSLDEAVVIELLCCIQNLTLFDPSHSLIIDHYFFERFGDSLVPFFGKSSRKKESNTSKLLLSFCAILENLLTSLSSDDEKTSVARRQGLLSVLQSHFYIEYLLLQLLIWKDSMMMVNEIGGVLALLLPYLPHYRLIPSIILQSSSDIILTNLSVHAESSRHCFRYVPMFSRCSSQGSGKSQSLEEEAGETLSRCQSLFICLQRSVNEEDENLSTSTITTNPIITIVQKRLAEMLSS